MSERDDHYWDGYRSALLDLRVALSGWTPTADVEGLQHLVDARIDGLLDERRPDDIPFYDEPHFRAKDPSGGHGPNGLFPVDTSYTAVPFEGEVTLVKAGLPTDNMKPDDAEGFAELLKRCAARARLPLEVQ